MKAGFRAKVFLGVFVAAAFSLLALAGVMTWQVRERQRSESERHLSDEAHLVADLRAQSTLAGPDLDREADRLGEIIAGRVTFIAEDGRVVGDSTQPEAEILSLENHLSRPEVIAARERGFGSTQRYSDTIGTDMVYVAVRTFHPVVTYVRLALPVTEVDMQLGRTVAGDARRIGRICSPCTAGIVACVELAGQTCQRYCPCCGTLFGWRSDASGL